MSSSLSEMQLITSSSSGMLDKFGTGGVINNQAAFFSIPSNFSAMPQDAWFIAQWSQPVAINPSNYVANDSMSYDQLYGNSLYTWSTPGATAAISLYQNTATLGGGTVLQLSDGSTQSSTLNEADIFLSSPNISPSLGNLSHPITLTLDSKVSQSTNEFVDQNTGAPILNGGKIWNNIDIGFTVIFNGADGLPRYGGFVQITPWSAQSNGSNPNYESQQANGFISSLLLGGDPFLAQLPADAHATPDALTYNINKYVYQTLEATYGNQSTANKAVLFNLGNWSVGGMYIGLATDNWPNSSAASLGAEISSTVQLSNIGLTSNEAAIYSPSTPPASLPIIDTNPQINFIDNTSHGVQGFVDGAVYKGSLKGIQDEYIYNGYDSISLMAPTSSNWYFGGGYGQTILSATSENNVFLASMGGSTMTGGNGIDTFIVPQSDTGFSNTKDTIINFHVGDSTILEGVSGAGWTYQWAESDGLTMDASNALHGLSELVTFSGLTMADTNHLNVSIDASGNLSIISTNAGAAIVGVAQASFPVIINIASSNASVTASASQMVNDSIGGNHFSISAASLVNISGNDTVQVADGTNLSQDSISGSAVNFGSNDLYYGMSGKFANAKNTLNVVGSGNTGIIYAANQDTLNESGSGNLFILEAGGGANTNGGAINVSGDNAFIAMSGNNTINASTGAQMTVQSNNNVISGSSISLQIMGTGNQVNLSGSDTVSDSSPYTYETNFTPNQTVQNSFTVQGGAFYIRGLDRLLQTQGPAQITMFGGNAVTLSGANDTVTAGDQIYGGNTIVNNGANNLIALQETNLAADTIVANASTTVTLTDIPGMHIGGNSGNAIEKLTFIGSSGTSSTILGSASNAAITMSGGASSANAVYGGFGGGNSLNGGTGGANLFVAGGTNDVLIGGSSGNNTLVSAAGNETFFTAATGTDLISITGGGGTDVLQAFTGKLQLASNLSVLNETTLSGSLNVTLNDGTKLIFSGLTSVTQNGGLFTEVVRFV